jgi:hypothetical protein
MVVASADPFLHCEPQLSRPARTDRHPVCLSLSFLSEPNAKSYLERMAHGYHATHTVRPEMSPEKILSGLQIFLAL